MTERDLTIVRRGAVPGLAETRGPTGIYATRLHQLARLELEESRAEALWREVSRHRRSLGTRLGRDVGAQVALLDYLANVQGRDEVALADRREASEAAQQAITDPLTGLFNRFFFQLELGRECERTLRYQLPASLVLLDLDRFAAINAEYGRETGDEVLQATASVILHHVRVPDVACRVGADEFAVLLPGTTQPDAMTTARRIAADIADWFRRSPVGLVTIDVSASVGVSSLPAGGSGETLLSNARVALRDARRLGGHRVVAPVTQAVN